MPTQTEKKRYADFLENMPDRLPSVTKPAAKITLPEGSKKSAAPKKNGSPGETIIETPAESRLSNTDRLLLRLHDGDQLDANEWQAIDALGLARTAIEREGSRLDSIRSLQHQAGSRGALVSLKVQLADDQAEAETEFVQLDAQVAEILSQRDAIAFQIRDLESSIKRRSIAMEQLRQRCPANVLRVHVEMIGAMKRSSVNVERVNLASRINSLSGLPVEWSEKNHDQIVAIANGLPVETRKNILAKQGHKVVVNKSAWHAYAKSQLAELPEMEKQLAEMEADFQKQKIEIDRQLDHYVPD